MTTHFTRQFLETLYPDPVTEAGGRLVLWTRRQGSRTSRSYWVESLDRAVELAGSLRRGFVGAGRPDQGLPSWGSFEEWSDLVRGAVVWLGYPDPAETCAELEETSAFSAERAFVLAFADVFADRGVTAREILERAADPPAGCQALRAGVEDLFPRLKPGELPTPIRLGGARFSPHRP